MIPAVTIMSADKQSILAAIADLLIFLLCRGDLFISRLLPPIEVVDKKMSLYGTIRRFGAIRIDIKSMHSPLRFEDQDLDSFLPVDVKPGPGPGSWSIAIIVVAMIQLK